MRTMKLKGVKLPAQGASATKGGTENLRGRKVFQKMWKIGRSRCLAPRAQEDPPSGTSNNNSIQKRVPEFKD